ncbi:hypothetical protein AAY473_024959 [Plecturocebus cupreus]
MENEKPQLHLNYLRTKAPVPASRSPHHEGFCMVLGLTQALLSRGKGGEEGNAVMWLLPQAQSGNEAAAVQPWFSRAGGEQKSSRLGEKLQEQFPDVHSARLFRAGSCRSNAGCQEENLPLAIESLQAQLPLHLHHTHGLAQVLDETEKRGLAVSSRLEYSGVITAHCSLDFLGSRCKMIGRQRGRKTEAG